MGGKLRALLEDRPAALRFCKNENEIYLGALNFCLLFFQEKSKSPAGLRL
jgi:hypothetical protein